MKKVLLFVLVVLFFGFVSADVPNYQDRYVNDFADVLNVEDVDILREMFQIVEQNTTAQVVFVSVLGTDGEEISDYALQIGEDWGVGQKDKNNGVVILYVKDTGKIWVSTGYGVEGVLPDSKIGRFLDENYVPLRDEGELSTGIVEFSFVMSEELVINSVELMSERKEENNYIFILIVIIFTIFVFYIASKGQNNNSFRRTTVFSTGGSHSSGSSFGGGSFGGGGAGR